jgi:hypothetical protein
MSITDLDEALASPGEATREFYRQQGRREEQERIIKLLEDAGDCKCSPEYGVDYDNTCYCDALLIIKGEK